MSGPRVTVLVHFHHLSIVFVGKKSPQINSRPAGEALGSSRAKYFPEEETKQGAKQECILHIHPAGSQNPQFPIST